MTKQTTTRRSFLRSAAKLSAVAAVAVAPVKCAPGPMAPAPAHAAGIGAEIGHPDAELLTLGQQFEAACREANLAADRLEKVDKLYYQRRPPWPDALRVRSSDLFSGLGRGQVCFDGVERYVYEAVERLRRGDWSSGFEFTGTEEEWEREDRGGKFQRTKSPQAQACVDQIISAYDEHEAACQRLRDEIGATEADECFVEASDRLDAVRERILDTEARTVHGLGVKAKVVFWDLPQWAKSSWREMEDQADQATLALVLNVARLAGLETLRS